MLGALLYLSTLQGVFHVIPLIYLVYKLVVNKGKLNLGNKELIFLTICGFMLFNYLLGAIINSGINTFPKFILMFFTVLLAKEITGKDVKILIVFLVVESIVGILQFNLGVNSFFRNEFSNLHEYGDELLYYRRVVGFSDGPTTLANKLMIGIVLLRFVDVSKKNKVIGTIIMYFALIYSFSRTSIVSMLVFELIAFFFLTKISNRIKIVLVFSISFILCITAAIYLPNIIGQFTRGSNSLDLTGRPEIWSHYLSFISNHLFCGNFSIKLWLNVSGFEGVMHAHNSVIEFVATHGAIISIIFFTFLVNNMDRVNIVLISPLLIYSMGNYGVFWGFSFLDVFFYYILFYFVPSDQRYQVNYSKRLNYNA